MKFASKALLLSALLFLTTQAKAQTDSLNLKKGKMTFQVSPYFWFIGVRGDISRPPEPSNPIEPDPIPPPTNLPEPDPFFNVDLKFRDLAASLKFAIMMSGEYEFNRFVTRFNVASVILEGNVVTPFDMILQDVQGRFAHASGDLTAGYSAIYKPKLKLKVMGGVKFIYINVDASSNLLGRVPFDANKSVLWLDPVAALRLTYTPFDRLELESYLDFGGNLGGSEINYQFIQDINFYVTRFFYLSTGYRYWAVEHQRGEIYYDGDIRGWVSRIGFRF